MKSKRTFLIRAAALFVVVLVAAVMFIVGRGHTIYLDNRTVEYNGQSYKGPYKVEVYINGEKVAKLYDKERGMADWMGQNLKMVLGITQEKGGEEKMTTVTMKLPYSMDGVVINLSALLSGLPEETYLSEFVSMATEAETADEEIVTDEFAIPTEE